MVKEKKSKRERALEMQALDGRSGCGIDYTRMNERHVDDKRFERNIKQAGAAATGPSEPGGGGDAKAPSATFDTFTRMVAGLDARTIADKINDPNRMTWEQFKKDNEDKLDLRGNEIKKMVEYRKQLDAERDSALARGIDRKKKEKEAAASSGEESGSSGSESGSEDARRKDKKKKRDRKEKERKRRKDKKRRKEKKRKHGSGDDDNDSDAEGGGSDSESGRRRHKKHRKRRHDKDADKAAKDSAAAKDQPVRLSQFLNGSSDESS